MKRIIFLIMTSCFCSIAQSQNFKTDEILELPIELIQGVAPFNPSYSSIYLKDIISGSPWEKIMVEVKGIPESWKEPIVQQIHFDFLQMVYQNYKQGNIEEPFVKYFEKHKNIDLEELDLSETPIKCFTHIVLTKLDNGDVLYKIDTDNDRDFSDEEVFSPISLNRSYQELDSLSYFAHLVDAEVFSNNQIQELKLPILIGTLLDGGVHNTFPQYAKTELLGKTILISSGFSDPSFREKARAVVLDKERINNRIIVEKNEFIEVDGEKFQNLGVDFGQNLLKLKKIDNDKKLYSTQVGYELKPFEGIDFVSGDSIKLEDYRGKFLFLEFWGTWCGPCVHEIPGLKSVYDKVDKEKVAFLGIAQDNAETLKKFLAEKEISWDQILSDNQNKLVQLYDINKFPSSFLIDGNGKIIAKDLRSYNLLETLEHFLSE